MANRPSHVPGFPESKKYVCRHCMQHFDDPKTRWRHSKWCIPRDSSTGRKLLDRNMRPLNVVVKRPAEHVNLETARTRNLKSLAGPGLSCFICFKKFVDVEEMKVHVRNPCNKEPAYNEEEIETPKKGPSSKRVPVPGEFGLVNYESAYDQNMALYPSVAMDTSMDVAMDVVIESDGNAKSEKGVISSSKRRSKAPWEPVDNGSPASTATGFTALTTRKRKQNPSPGRWSYLAESDRPSRSPKDPSETSVSFANLAKVKPSLKTDIGPSIPSPKPKAKKVRWHSSVDDAMYELPKSLTKHENVVMKQTGDDIAQRTQVSESETQITFTPELSEKQSEVSEGGENRLEDDGIECDVNEIPPSETASESEPIVNECQDRKKSEDHQSHYIEARSTDDLINNEEYDKIIRGIHEAKQEKTFDPDPYEYYFPPKRRKKVTSRGAGKCKLVYPKEIVKSVKDDYLPGEKMVVRKPNFLQKDSKPVDQDTSHKKKKKNKRKKRLTVEDLLEDDFEFSDVELSDLDINPANSKQKNKNLPDATASDDISTSAQCGTLTISKTKKIKAKNIHSSKFKCISMDPDGTKRPKFKLVIKALGSKIKLQSSSIAKKKLEKSLKERAALKIETTKPHRCRICTRVFKSAHILVKHNQMPCMVQHTRNMCQKILRPKKSVEDNSSYKKIFSKSLHLLDSPISRRIYEPSKNYKRNSKNDFPGKYDRMLSCLPSKLHPQHLLVHSELSEKEQYFYSLDMILMEKMKLFEVEQKKSLLEKPLSSLEQENEPEMPPLMPISGEILFENDEELPPLLEPMDCFESSHLQEPLLSMQQLPIEDLEPPVLEQIVCIERTIVCDDDSNAADTEILNHFNSENAIEIEDRPTTENSSSKDKSPVLRFDLNKGLNMLRNKCLPIISKSTDIESIKIIEKTPESPDFETPTIAEASNVSEELATKVCPHVIKSVLTINENYNSIEVQSESKPDASISHSKREKTRNVFESLSEWCQADTSEERTNIKADENTEELNDSSAEDYVKKSSFDDAIANTDNMGSLLGKEISAHNKNLGIRESLDEMKSTFDDEISTVDTNIEVNKYHLDECQDRSAENDILGDSRDDDTETKLISCHENEDKCAAISIHESCQENSVIANNGSTFDRFEVSASSVNEASEESNLTRNVTAEEIRKSFDNECSAETNSTPSENHSQFEPTIDTENSEEMPFKSLSCDKTFNDVTSFDVSNSGTCEVSVDIVSEVQSLSTLVEKTSYDMNMKTNDEKRVVAKPVSDVRNNTDEVTITSPSSKEFSAEATEFDIEDNSFETKSIDIPETSLPKLMVDANINSNELESTLVSVNDICTENTSFGDNERTVQIIPTISPEPDVDQKSEGIATTSESSKEMDTSSFVVNRSSDEISLSNSFNTITTESTMEDSNGVEKLKLKSTNLNKSEESKASNAEGVRNVSKSVCLADQIAGTEETSCSDLQTVIKQPNVMCDDISIMERCIQLYACQPSVPKLKKAIICLEDICLKGDLKQRIASSGSLKESNESCNKASSVTNNSTHLLEQKPNLKLTIYRSKNSFSLKQNESVLPKAVTITSSQDDLMETELTENYAENQFLSSSSNKKRLKRHHHEHNKGEKHHRHRHKSKSEAASDVVLDKDTTEHLMCEDVITLSDSVSSEVSRTIENINITVSADEKEETSCLLKPDVCEQGALTNVNMLPIPEDQHSISAVDTGIAAVKKDEETPDYNSGVAAEILHESNDIIMQLDTSRQIFEDDTGKSKIDEIESNVMKDNDSIDEIEPNVVKDDKNMDAFVEQQHDSSSFIIYPESWSAVGPIKAKDGPSFNASNRFPVSNAVYEDISEDDSLDYVVYQNISGDEIECQQPISDTERECKTQSSDEASISGNVTDGGTPVHLPPEGDDSKQELSETHLKMSDNKLESKWHFSNENIEVEDNVNEAAEHSNSVVCQNLSKNGHHLTIENDGLYQNISDDEREIHQSLSDAKCKLPEDFSKDESVLHNISEDGSPQHQQFSHKSKNAEAELPDIGPEAHLSQLSHEEDESDSHITEEESEAHNHSDDSSSQRQLSSERNDSETKISNKGTEAMWELSGNSFEGQQNFSNETIASDYGSLQRINSSEMITRNLSDINDEMQESKHIHSDANFTKPDLKESDSVSFDKSECSAEYNMYTVHVSDASCSAIQNDKKDNDFLTVLDADKNKNIDNVHVDTVCHQDLQSDSKIGDSFSLQGERTSENKGHPDQNVASVETENALLSSSGQDQNIDGNKSEPGADETKESAQDDGAQTEGNSAFNQFKWGIDMEYDSISECDFEETENQATFEPQQTSDIGNVIDDSEFKASLSESVNFGFSI